jgi:hypothetical protein
MKTQRNGDKSEAKDSKASIGSTSELSGQELEKVTGGNIGSQSSGAGAGKVTFNPFSITRKIDISSS